MLSHHLYIGDQAKISRTLSVGFMNARSSNDWLAPALSVFVVIASIAVCLLNPMLRDFRWGLVLHRFSDYLIYICREQQRITSHNQRTKCFHAHLTWPWVLKDKFTYFSTFDLGSDFGRQAKNYAWNLLFAVGILCGHCFAGRLSLSLPD